MPELWTPTTEGPHEAFVGRLHRAIARFAEATGVATPVVEVEFADSGRFVVDRFDPDPGFGMITLYVNDVRDDAPDAIVIPIGAIRRVELSTTPEERVSRVGFSVPPPSA